MASFNKSILIGNLTSDPELKQTTSGISVCSFSIAVNRRFAKDGEQNVDFINIQAWRQQAEFVCQYFRKGQPILICGQIQTRSWTDNQGNKRYATEVVADEVSFVAARESAIEQKNSATAGVPNAAQKGSYTPSAYTQPQMNFQTQQPQFEEIPNDSDLPF